MWIKYYFQQLFIIVFSSTPTCKDYGYSPCQDKTSLIFNDNLVSSTGLIMWIGHRKEIRKLTFRAFQFYLIILVSFFSFRWCVVNTEWGQDLEDTLNEGKLKAETRLHHENRFKLCTGGKCCAESIFSPCKIQNRSCDHRLHELTNWSNSTLSLYIIDF